MRKIIHVDMDCFYAAIEIRDNPKLKGHPVAIGGRPSERLDDLTDLGARQFSRRVRAAFPAGGDGGGGQDRQAGHAGRGTRPGVGDLQARHRAFRADGRRERRQALDARVVVNADLGARMPALRVNERVLDDDEPRARRRAHPVVLDDRGRHEPFRRGFARPHGGHRDAIAQRQPRE